ncbi:MAG: 16S rRNA (uracil(1498)-N(3))-methyltransferase [Verrucomicrobiota bacterium]
MPRFYLPPAAWLASGTPPVLTGDEARHLAQVLRIQPGASICVFDGQGRHTQAKVLDVSRGRVTLDLGEVRSGDPVIPIITLAQAIPKGKNMDLIVQKAVELGVAVIQPLVTRHTIVHPGEGKSEKWRRTALEACKQCGQNLLPDIPETLPLGVWLRTQTAANSPPILKLIASLGPTARPLRNVLRQYPLTTQATLLIGPEGDFSAAESAAALAAGFLPVSLGSIVLRVETASLYGLSALRYQFGNV